MRRTHLETFRIRINLFFRSAGFLFLLLCLASPFCQAAERAPQVTASAKILKSKVRVGDEIRLFIQVERPRKFKTFSPDPKLNISPFEIKSIDPEVRISGQNRIRETYGLTLTVFQTGDLSIPPIAVVYENGEGARGQVYTDKISVKVVSVGKKLTDKNDIRPIKGPVSIGLTRFWNGVLAVMIAVLFVVLAVILFLRIRRERKDQESRKPANERVRIELERLKDRGFLEEKNYKAYYSEFSDILRRYLERRFQVETLERTSTEINEELEKISELSSETRVKAAEVLKESDLVKFAKFAPSHELAVSLEKLLFEIVDETKPV